jgi:hypothetical protein
MKVVYGLPVKSMPIRTALYSTRPLDSMAFILVFYDLVKCFSLAAG